MRYIRFSLLLFIVFLYACDVNSYKKRTRHCFQVENDTKDTLTLQAWTSVTNGTKSIENGNRKIIWISQSNNREYEDIELSLRIINNNTNQRVWKTTREYHFDDVGDHEQTGCKTVSVQMEGQDDNFRVYDGGFVRPQPIRK